MAQELDLGVMSWSPLGGGVLSAKYEGSDRQSKGRWADRMIDPRASAIARLVAEIAQELGRTPAQVALAWIRQQSRHSNAIIPVLGARTAAQIEDNIGCLTAVLSVDQVRRLEQASAIDMGQLHSFLTERGPLSARDLAFAGQYDVVDSRARPRLST